MIGYLFAISVLLLVVLLHVFFIIKREKIMQKKVDLLYESIMNINKQFYTVGQHIGDLHCIIRDQKVDNKNQESTKKDTPDLTS